MNRRHEGNPWRVKATHKTTGQKIQRVTDGAGVRLMVECGYKVDSISEVKPDPVNSGWNH